MVLASLLALLSGCALPPSHDQKLDPARPVGLVTGTVTYETAMGRYGVIVQSLDRPKELTYLHVGPTTWSVFVDTYDKELGSRGGVYAYELAAGPYQVIAWRSIQGAWTGTSSRPFAIPFVVERGKATYLGNIHFERGEDGWEARMGDRAERDLPVIRKKIAGLASAPMIHAMPEDGSRELVGGTYTTMWTLPVVIPVPAR